MFGTTETSHFDDQWNYNLEQNIPEIKTPTPTPHPLSEIKWKNAAFWPFGRLNPRVGDREGLLFHFVLFIPRLQPS